MADYSSLVSIAVANLGDSNTSENRDALYARARVALVEQLREIKPPLSDAQLIHEQAELERAIRKVEAHYVQASRYAPKGITPIAPMPKLFPKD
jgi:hypothetical protein